MALENGVPHIGIMRASALPETLSDEFLADIDAPLLKTASQTHEGMFAGIELLMPTAVAIYITHQYFGSMISELGKDHYEVLKRAAKSLYKKTSQIKLSLRGSPGKLPPSQPYSLLFSITASLNSAISIKFLLQRDIPDAQAEQAIEAFFEFIDSVADGSVSPELVARISSTRIVSRTLLIAYDFEQKTIFGVDPMPSFSKDT